jgi:hypothetical protein
MAPFPILFFIFVEVPSMGAMLAHKGIMLATGNETKPLNVWLYRLIGVTSLFLLLIMSFAIGADAACLLFVLLIGGGLFAFITKRKNGAVPAAGQPGAGQYHGGQGYTGGQYNTAPATGGYGPPPQQPGVRDEVASFLEGMQQYERTKDLAVLDRTIAEGRAVVRAEQDIERWRTFSIVLGQALMSRHLATTDQSALAEAVEVLRSVGTNLPEGHRLRPQALIELGAALREFGVLSGRLELVDEAIHWYGLCSAIESPKRAQAFVSISMCLKIKADRLGDAALLDQAVPPARYAAQIAPDPQVRGKYLVNLSALLVLVHRRTEDPATIQEAVSAAEEALRLSPDEQERQAREKVLAVARAQQQLGGWIE